MARQIATREEVVASKRERVPLHQSRDRIKTRGLDVANFHYKFIDINDAEVVTKHQEAGYAPTEKDGSIVGDKVVDSSTGTTSLITIPGGQGKLLALFQLPREYYIADQESEEEERKLIEQGLVKDINSTADPRHGNIGTGVSAFANRLTPTSVDQDPAK